MAQNDLQEFHDSFYWRNGPCCAGCDHWRYISSLVGDCTNSKIVSGQERASILGIMKSSLDFGAGHAITYQGYRCGMFKDTFDWSSLPLPYRKRVGVPV